MLRLTCRRDIDVTAASRLLPDEPSGSDLEDAVRLRQFCHTAQLKWAPCL